MDYETSELVSSSDPGSGENNSADGVIADIESVKAWSSRPGDSGRPLWKSRHRPPSSEKGVKSNTW